MASTERARHQAMRVWETPRTFSNWATVLADMAREKVGRGPESLTFNTREGLVIECPNRAGARVPIYEIFAEDCYHFEWFLGALAGQPLQVLDIGGQIGAFACRLAQLEPKATIRTYEPSPTSASVLRGNVERNGFGDRITVVEEALAATVGSAELDDNEGGSGTNSLVERAAQPGGHDHRGHDDVRRCRRRVAGATDCGENRLRGWRVQPGGGLLPGELGGRGALGHRVPQGPRPLVGRTAYLVRRCRVVRAARGTPR